MKQAFIVVFLVTVLLSLGSANVSLASQMPSGGLETSLPPSSKGYMLVVRAYYTDREMVNELASWLEPWEVHPDEGYIVVGVTETQLELLRAMGFRIEVDPRLTQMVNRAMLALPGQTNGIPGYPCYRTVEETYTSAQNIATHYPQLASWIDIGDSWEKVTPGGNPGYNLQVLRLTNTAISGEKPKLFVMGAIHARELATAELLIRFAEYLVQNYSSNPDITWILDYHEIHLLFQSNPDGRKQAESGKYWRKNTNQNYCSPTSDWRGADLNRNFEFQWGCCGGSSSTPCDETYRGPSPSSEPETQAVRDYVRAIFPDQRGPGLDDPAPSNATGMFIDIHSYGQLVLWPWGFTSSAPPNGTALQTLGRKLAFFNGYTPDQAYGLYPTDGTTDDFAYGDLGVAGYTFEIGTAFFQSCAIFESTVLPDNLNALIYAAKTARRPYQTPAGPDALNITALPSGIPSGSLFQLKATINDTRYNNSNGTEPIQNIAAARYSIDVPPWSTNPPAVTYPMVASDGNFNSKTEQVSATVDTAGLSFGRHMVFVQGQDALGNWGAPSATFIQILDPNITPTVQGFILQADNYLPLNATVSAGYFSTASNPTTGFYTMEVISGTYNLTATAPGFGSSSVSGLVAQDYQTIQQDFLLYPTCQVFQDDVEAGVQSWTPQSPWAITTEVSYSPSRSWTDSPGGNYANNTNASLISPSFDLRGFTSTTLYFLHTYNIETGYDYGYVESSVDGGNNWTIAKSYTGVHSEWSEKSISLPEIAGQPDVRIRFRLFSDSFGTQDGWYIDDIRIVGSGPACISTPTLHLYLPWLSR